MKRNPFIYLRVATCIALVALLGGRILLNGPTINLLLFLLLIIFWFVPTLALEIAAHTETARMRALNNTLCAVLDAYVLLMATAEAASDIWTKPFLLLGGYTFLACLTGGITAGAGSAVFGLCGLINGWLIPNGKNETAFVLFASGAALVGFVCGCAWRLLLPRLTRAVQQPAAAPATSASPEQEMLAGMELRLQGITSERDLAQERLRKLESLPITPPPPAPPAAAPASALPAGPADLSPQACLLQMEAELTSLQTEQASLAKEKQQLMAENSRLSDELMSAFMPAPSK